MSNNMDDLFANVKKMVDSGNIPDNIKQMMNNLNVPNNTSTNQSNSNNNTNTNFNNPDLNDILNQVSPEMLNNLGNMLNSNNQSNQDSSQNNNFNFDMNTIMKMKSIMENMNNKNDPRANLLYSLKPYLRDSKKDKLDQYVNLLNVSKIAELMNKKDNDTKS